MLEKEFKPGDEVCTIDDLTKVDFHGESYLNVAKGRLGTVISFEEYWAYFEKPHKYSQESLNRLRKSYYSKWKKDVQDGWICPVRFYPTDDKKDQTSYYPEGFIDMLGTRDLARLEFLDQNTVFIFEPLRVIFAEGGHAFQPDWGYKALVVDFMLENRGAQALCLAASLQIWLTYIPPGCASPDGMRVEPIHLDLADGNLAAHARLSGQAIFHVPGGTETHAFHLEIANVGAVEKVIDLPAFQPGDRVRLKRSTRNVMGQEPDTRLYRWITKGSIGSIVSFSQYQKYLRLKYNAERAPDKTELYDDFCGFLRDKVEKRGLFPGLFSGNEGYPYLLRLELVYRSADEHYPDEKEYTEFYIKEFPSRREPPVEEGEIIFVSSEDLEKIE